MKKRTVKRIILFTIIGIVIVIMGYIAINWEQISESEAFKKGYKKGMGIEE